MSSAVSAMPLASGLGGGGGFHRVVADRIIERWVVRQRSIEGYDAPLSDAVPPDGDADFGLAASPGVLAVGGDPGERPALSSVADMTRSIGRVYDALLRVRPVHCADARGGLAADGSRLVLWVVAVGDLGGVARHVLDTVRAGIPGWRLMVLCPEGPLAERLRALGAAVFTAPISPDDSLARGLWHVRRTVQSVRPAVVHSHLAYSDFLVAGATAGRGPRVARDYSPRLVSTEHGIAGDDVVYHGSRAASRAMAAAHAARLRRFDALIAVSEATLGAVRRKWHPPRGLLTTVIPNGVDAPAVAPAPVAGRFHVVSLSRLAPEKGLFDLLEAFALVRADHPEATLTMAGEGPLRAQLSERVADLGLQAEVSMPGFVEPETLLPQADVLVQLSTWENCSYSLLDGLAHGVGIVATDVGGNAILNGDGDTPPPQIRRLHRYSAHLSKKLSGNHQPKAVAFVERSVTDLGRAIQFFRVRDRPLRELVTRYRTSRKYKIPITREIIATSDRAILTADPHIPMDFVCKIYDSNEWGAKAFEAEKLAEKLFGAYAWKIHCGFPLHNLQRMPRLDSNTRLDRLSRGLSPDLSIGVCASVLEVIMDLFLSGYSHCDLHARNIFVRDWKLTICDFEGLEKIPVGVGFEDCRDLWTFTRPRLDVEVDGRTVQGPDSLLTTFGHSLASIARVASDRLSTRVRETRDGHDELNAKIKLAQSLTAD